MLGIPLLVLGPWIAQELRFAQRDSQVHIEIQPHAIWYSHRFTTYVIPFSAIRMVDASENQTPLVTLKLDWADEHIQCPRHARGLPVSWVFETWEQARWLTVQLRRVIAAQDPAAAGPESLAALGTAAAAAPLQLERAAAAAGGRRTSRRHGCRCSAGSSSSFWLPRSRYGSTASCSSRLEW